MISHCACSTSRAILFNPMKPVRVEVNDLMQKGYIYYRTKPMGRGFSAAFKPELTPKQMLELGVFGGKS